MLMIIISRSNSKRGHVGSKSKSQGQIIEKPFVASRGQSFDPKLCNFARMIILIKSKSRLKLDHVASKTRLLDQIIEKPCVHSRGHIFSLPGRPASALTLAAAVLAKSLTLKFFM